MEVNPSWKQLAAIPESAQKAAILKALGIVPPPEGISDTFHDRGLYVRHVQNGSAEWLVSNPGDDGPFSAGLYADGSAALRACRCPAGTPMGDALRQWMRSRGWVPASERKQAEPTENTRTII
jgi:hypothetical protein